MGKASKIRAHLMKQFGGAGEDLQARQDQFELGLLKASGSPAFPPGVDMPEKLRQLEAERTALTRLCPKAKQQAYEYSQESTLVKIVLRHLRHTSYQSTVKDLLHEIKVRQDIAATIPVWNGLLQAFELPSKSPRDINTDDWDYRNFHSDWLPTWAALKSKLVSVWRETKFEPAGTVKASASKLPVMFIPAEGGPPVLETPYESTVSVLFMPGAGANPRTSQCFGCGQHGHRKGDPGCTAGPNDWHSCTPERFLGKTKKSGKKGVDGFYF